MSIFSNLSNDNLEQQKDSLGGSLCLTLVLTMRRLPLLM